MAEIIPFKPAEAAKVAVFSAADELFSDQNLDYSVRYKILEPAALIEVATGAARTALSQVIESQQVYDRSVEVSERFQYHWRNRTIAQKLSDVLRGRHMDTIFPEAAPTSRVNDENYLVYDRSIAGKIYIGNNRRYEPADVLVTDRFLEGTFRIDDHEYELSPKNRMVRVDLTIHRSRITNYDSHITYAVHPGDDDIEHKHTKVFGIEQEHTSSPNLSNGAREKVDKMVRIIRSLGPSVS